jgi:hypothetical protein
MELSMPKPLLLIPAIVIALAIAIRPVSAQPAATTHPAAHDIDPAIETFMTPMESAPGDSELIQMMKQKHNSAVRLLDLRVREYRSGVGSLSLVFDAARTVADAKMELAQTADARVGVAEQVLAVTRDMEDRMQKQVSAGFGSQADLERAKLARLTAEVELLKLRSSSETTRRARSSPSSAATTRPS